MKKILFGIFFVCVANFCKSQNTSKEDAKYTIVRQDTINIRGIVYNVAGQPAPLVLIRSKNKNAVFDGYPIYAVTDSSGRFQLKGVLFKDTLDFIDNRLSIINNGSRYLEIHLPQQNENIFIPSGEVIAKRQYKKKPMPAFKVQNDAGISILDGFGGTQSANYKQGNFVAYIRSKVNYPEKALQNNIEGDVQVSFVVAGDGVVKDIKIVRGIGYGCDEAVANAFINCPNWRPAITMGNPISERYTLTINFKLTDK